MFCAKCGALLPENANFCGLCGASVESPVKSTLDSNVYQTNTYVDTLQKPKSKKKLGLLISGIVLVVALAMVLLYALVLKTGDNPVKAVKDALMNTVDAKSITVEIDLKDGSRRENGEIQLELRDEDLYVSLVDYGDNKLKQEFYVLDEDGFYHIRQDYDYDSKYRVSKEMTSSDAKEFREALTNVQKSEGAVIKQLEEYLDDELGSYVDCTDLYSLWTSVIDEMGSPDNLKDCLGFEEIKKDGQTLYTFNPDLYNCARLILEQAKPRFDTTKEYSSVLTYLKAMKQFINEMEMEISVGIKDDKIASFFISPDLSEDETLKCTITDVNSTNVELPDEALQALVEYKLDRDEEY